MVTRYMSSFESGEASTFPSYAAVLDGVYRALSLGGVPQGEVAVRLHKVSEEVDAVSIEKENPDASTRDSKWGSRLEIDLINMGGAFVFVLGGSGEPAAQGIWHKDSFDMDDIFDVVERVAKYGIVWAGFPVRDSCFWVSPYVPGSDDELQRLLSRRYLEYAPGWSAR